MNIYPHATSVTRKLHTNITSKYALRMSRVERIILMQSATAIESCMNTEAKSQSHAFFSSSVAAPLALFCTRPLATKERVSPVPGDCRHLGPQGRLRAHPCEAGFRHSMPERQHRGVPKHRKTVA